MGEPVFHLKPDEVRAFARQVFSVADAIATVDINTTLLSAANACGGTALVDGLRTHAQEQHQQAQALSTNLDDLGSAILNAISSAQRVDDALPPAQDT